MCCVLISGSTHAGGDATPEEHHAVDAVEDALQEQVRCSYLGIVSCTCTGHEQAQRCLVDSRWIHQFSGFMSNGRTSHQPSMNTNNSWQMHST